MARVAENLKIFFTVDVSVFVPEYGEQTYPRRFDWREHLILTVKDQGGRKNSALGFAFAAAGILEAVEQMHTKKVVTVSEQHIINCSAFKLKRPDEMIRLPFRIETALRLIKYEGYFENTTYPYTGSISAKCDKTKTPIPFPYMNGIMFRMGGAKYMKMALRYGPLVCYISAGDGFWTSGKDDTVHTQKKDSLVTLFPVLLVGYNDDAKTPYWIIKTSMGKGWGRDGYLKVSQKKDENFGINYICYVIKHEKKITPWNEVFPGYQKNILKILN